MSLLPRLLMLGCLLLPAAVQAQQTAEKSATYEVATGQSWLDARLVDINHYAERYPDSFLDELERYAGVRRGYAQALMADHGWHAADVYFACFWAKVVEGDCRTYVRARTNAADPQAGWRGVLQGSDPKPEQGHWRALRSAIDASYQHWDRPRP